MNPQRELRSAAVPALVGTPQRQTVLWIIAILLAIIATALVMRPPEVFSLPVANADTPMMGARGVFAFTGQLDKNSYGLFMMDVDSSNVWCYQYTPGTRKLKLVAARSFSYDRYLEDYNCEEPTIEETKLLLDDQRRIRDRIRRTGITPDESNGALSTEMPGVPTE